MAPQKQITTRTVDSLIEKDRYVNTSTEVHTNNKFDKNVKRGYQVILTSEANQMYQPYM